MTENVDVRFEGHIEKKFKTLTVNINGSFCLIVDTVGRNFARYMRTKIQKKIHQKSVLEILCRK